MILLKLFLLPVSFFYGIFVWFRNKFFDWGFFKSTSFDVPIISVGNITSGGTGKTPHVDFLANNLKKKIKTAIIKKKYYSHLDEKRFLEKNNKVFFNKNRNSFFFNVQKCT